MKVFKTMTRKIISLIIACLLTINFVAYGYNVNPNRKDVEAMIDAVALKRAIPSVVLKSIVKLESSFAHFNSDGSPKISGNCIGLMMINNKTGIYDLNRLKYDINYNIEAGADVLLNKWSMSSYHSVSSVGDMNPDILENWYFALWAYNGWSQSNNPNMLPSAVKIHTYQQRIYDICRKEYNMEITNIDFSYLPNAGKPSRSLVVPTPANMHSGGIVLYEAGDFVRTDGVRDTYNLRDVPSGKYVYNLPNNQLLTITEGPVLKDGYYWYKVCANDSIKGWIERNWLLRTGDIQYGRYVFDDIAFHWARKHIMELYNRGIIAGASSFNPDDKITKEAFCVFLSKALGLNKDANAIVLPFNDKENISSWALESVKNVYNSGFLNKYIDFKPQDKITRKEAALIFSNIFETDSKYQSIDINTIFNDVSGLNSYEISAVKEVYTQGIMSYKNNKGFCPEDNLSRAEVASMIVKLLSKKTQ